MPRFYHKRRARRIRYQRPVAPPFRWFLTPAETCLSLGISRLTLQRWMQSWTEGNPNPQGPQPFILSRRKDGRPSQVRYRWEEVLRLPEGTFLEQLKSGTMQTANNDTSAVSAIAGGEK
jgi:hypothetical protein